MKTGGINSLAILPITSAMQCTQMNFVSGSKLECKLLCTLHACSHYGMTELSGDHILERSRSFLDTKSPEFSENVS